MNKKIIGIFVCMLLIGYAIPVLGLAGEPNNATIAYQDPNQSYRLKVEHLNDGRLPPDPGEMPEGFVIKESGNIQRTSNPPDRTILSDDETIIEILENLD